MAKSYTHILDIQMKHADEQMNVILRVKISGKHLHPFICVVQPGPVNHIMANAGGCNMDGF